MKKISVALALAVLLLAPSASHAIVEVGAGWGLTAFSKDLDGIDTGDGLEVEMTLGTGVMRLMLAAQSSSHDQGDYESWMAGPSWTLDMVGFDSRIYALLSSHSFETVDGWGVTLGGGVGWPIFPAADLGLEVRISQWEGDGLNVGTGSMLLLFRIGF